MSALGRNAHRVALRHSRPWPNMGGVYQIEIQDKNKGQEAQGNGGEGEEHPDQCLLHWYTSGVATYE